MLKERRSIRLRGYDYTRAGAYFVTICTRNGECLFGDVVDGEMRLNQFGEIVRDEWMKSAQIRRELELDVFVIMPNHVHGIVAVVNHAPVGATGRSPLPCGPAKKSLGSFVAGFKPAVTKRINEIRGTRGISVWQRNYYEHIVRAESELNRIRQYIVDNPAKWELDRENPNRIRETGE